MNTEDRYYVMPLYSSGYREEWIASKDYLQMLRTGSAHYKKQDLSKNYLADLLIMHTIEGGILVPKGHSVEGSTKVCAK